MAAPTRVSCTETTSWITTGAPKSIASISWQTNDVVAFLALSEAYTSGQFAWATPTNTGSGLSWAQKVVTTAGSVCGAVIYAAVASASSSGVITETPTGSNANGLQWGFAVWVYRVSAGSGNSVTQQTTTKTKALTPTAPHCAVIWGVGDFSAEAAHAVTPTPTTTVEATQGTGYSAHVGDLTDQSSGGAVSYGITAGTSTGPYSIVAFEIKASAAAGLVIEPVVVMQGVKRAAEW